MNSDFCLDFRNVNQLWASILVESLYRLGLRHAVICPGSRSAPLTIAFAQHPGIEAIPVLDERSASFFALGLARQHHRATALVCTSGTAGANFYPAVIEARESQVPLLVLTADRPPELRHCHAGQAIDQVKLFGQYPTWQTELRLPNAASESLAYLRQTVSFSWEQTYFPQRGPVHLNIPLREPLAPLSDPNVEALEESFNSQNFFAHLTSEPSVLAGALIALPPWQKIEKGIIIIGLAQPQATEDYVQAIAQLSESLGWPVLADALNPLRSRQSQLPNLICQYDLILRQPEHQQSLRPEAVLRLGELPTSKVLRQWLSKLDCRQWVLSNRPGNFDPLHGPTQHLRCSLPQLARQLVEQAVPASPQSQRYNYRWQQLENQTQANVDQAMLRLTELREPKLPWLLSQTLPEQTPLFIANSTPIRDMEWFWQRSDRNLLPYFNRGANGIDGTLSTALGIAQGNRPSVMVTGDLALLHDTNGWLSSSHLQGHLTIILINNNGGGIFELLPIAKFEPPFEKFFATPQTINFAALCHTYGASYEQITSWEQLKNRVNALPKEGIRLLELQTNRKTDTQWRSQLLATASQSAHRA